MSDVLCLPSCACESPIRAKRWCRCRERANRAELTAVRSSTNRFLISRCPGHASRRECDRLIFFTTPPPDIPVYLPRLSRTSTHAALRASSAVNWLLRFILVASFVKFPVVWVGLALAVVSHCSFWAWLDEHAAIYSAPIQIAHCARHYSRVCPRRGML